MARHGAREVVAEGPGSDRGRRAPPRSGPRPRDAPPEPFVAERFERVEGVNGSHRGGGDGGQDGAGRAGPTRPDGPRRGRPRPATPPRAGLPAEIEAELESAAGSDWPRLRRRVCERMQAGLGAYERERFQDAARALKVVVDAVPDAAAPRELLGLSQYRLGRWRAARTNLEAVGARSGSVDQHPVLMDCERALGRPGRVRALFEELRRASPDADLLAEGRLVLAATMADAGDLAGATALLSASGAGRAVRNPAPRHLRQWYVLADLAERSGDLARARDLFARIASADPDAYDVADRLALVGGAPPNRRGRVSRPPSNRRRSPGPSAAGR